MGALVRVRSIVHHLAGPRIRLTGLLLSVLLLSACANAVASPTPAPPTDTPAPTGTTAWFPPTRTPSPLPVVTVVPTLDRLSGVGAPILEDDFSDPAPWVPSSGPAGSVTVSGGGLTLAVRPERFLLALREGPELADFYLEVTARPRLCRERDEYGLVVRAADGSNYYRFVLICNGQVRLDRVRGGDLAYLQPPVPSGDVPPGAPAEVRLGVWAYGTELRFFVNGHYQFRINDPTLRGGRIGLFARATSTSAVTVVFEDLQVFQIDAPLPTDTPAPEPSVTPTATQ